MPFVRPREARRRLVLVREAAGLRTLGTFDLAFIPPLTDRLMTTVLTYLGLAALVVLVVCVIAYARSRPLDERIDEQTDADE